MNWYNTLSIEYHEDRLAPAQGRWLEVRARLFSLTKICISLACEREWVLINVLQTKIKNKEGKNNFQKAMLG